MTEVVYPINQSSSVTYVARICKGDGTALAFADVDSIDCALSWSGGSSTPSVDAGTSIQDGLQTSDNEQFWPYAPGYNFVHEIDSSEFAAANTDYTLQYRFVLVDSSEFTTTPITLHTGTSVV